MHLCIDVEGGKKGCCGHNRIIGIIVFEKCFMMMILEYISIMVIDKEKSTLVGLFALEPTISFYNNLLWSFIIQTKCVAHPFDKVSKTS